MSERVTHALDYARKDSDNRSFTGTKEALTVLADEVERLRERAEHAEKSSAMDHEGLRRSMDARLQSETARDEAIERATKAEQVIADVRELGNEWRHGTSGGDLARDAARDLLALLPDETGDDRG